MKQFVLILGIILGLIGPAHAQSISRLPGGESPLPWGMESPFPWENIQGVWKTSELGTYTFRFEIIRETTVGTKYLSVSIVDGVGDLVARGVGVARKGDRVVRAQVTDFNGDYYILVRMYEKADSMGRNQKLTFLTVRPMNNNPQQDVHYLIRKVGEIPKIKR